MPSKWFKPNGECRRDRRWAAISVRGGEHQSTGADLLEGARTIELRNDPGPSGRTGRDLQLGELLMSTIGVGMVMPLA